MSTRTTLSTVSRLVIGAACLISSAACGGELLRTGRSPVFLTIESMTATPGGGGTTASFLLSDVEVLIDETVNGVTRQVPTIFNDSLLVSVRANEKNPAAVATLISNVTLTRYRVDFRRADGRNTPGVDVPHGFDGGLGVTMAPGAAVNVGIEIVRHQAKLEPPLANLARGGGQIFISTIAEVTLYGRDQNGNEVTATGRIDVQFGDFGDQ
jgi:hypothetical protein